MIEALIFDMDGTLVKTEQLKARASALAAVDLAPDRVTEAAVIGKYKDVVGRSREEVFKTLVDYFGLEAAARTRMAELGVDAPWKAFGKIRMRHYEAMLADPEILKASLCRYNLALLRSARKTQRRTGLATMSDRDQTERILTSLEIYDLFDAIVTSEDVEHSKPHPEIYWLAAQKLGVEPWVCLVIEDSAPGVQAALTAGMWCIAVPSDLTRESVHLGNLLSPEWIVDDPADLERVAQRLMDQVGQVA